MTPRYLAVLVAELHALDLAHSHDAGQECASWAVQAIGLYGHLLGLYLDGLAAG